VFAEALEIHDLQERAAYLDRACAGDPALRQRACETIPARPCFAHRIAGIVQPPLALASHIGSRGLCSPRSPLLRTSARGDYFTGSERRVAAVRLCGRQLPRIPAAIGTAEEPGSHWGAGTVSEAAGTVIGPYRLLDWRHFAHRFGGPWRPCSSFPTAVRAVSRAGSGPGQGRDPGSVLAACSACGEPTGATGPSRARCR